MEAWDLDRLEASSDIVHDSQHGLPIMTALTFPAPTTAFTSTMSPRSNSSVETGGDVHRPKSVQRQGSHSFPGSRLKSTTDMRTPLSSLSQSFTFGMPSFKLKKFIPRATSNSKAKAPPAPSGSSTERETSDSLSSSHSVLTRAAGRSLPHAQNAHGTTYAEASDSICETTLSQVAPQQRSPPKVPKFPAHVDLAARGTIKTMKVHPGTVYPEERDALQAFLQCLSSCLTACKPSLRPAPARARGNSIT